MFFIIVFLITSCFGAREGVKSSKSSSYNESENIAKKLKKASPEVVQNIAKLLSENNLEGAVKVFLNAEGALPKDVLDKVDKDKSRELALAVLGSDKLTLNNIGNLNLLKNASIFSSTLDNQGLEKLARSLVKQINDHDRSLDIFDSHRGVLKRLEQYDTLPNEMASVLDLLSRGGLPFSSVGMLPTRVMWQEQMEVVKAMYNIKVRTAESFNSSDRVVKEFFKAMPRDLEDEKIREFVWFVLVSFNNKTLPINKDDSKETILEIVSYLMQKDKENLALDAIKAAFDFYPGIATLALQDIIFGSAGSSKDKYNNSKNMSFLHWLLDNDEFDIDFSNKISRLIGTSIATRENLFNNINFSGFDSNGRSFLFYLLTNPDEDIFVNIVQGLNTYEIDQKSWEETKLSIYQSGLGTNINFDLKMLIFTRSSLLGIDFLDYAKQIANKMENRGKPERFFKKYVPSVSEDVFRKMLNDLKQYYELRKKNLQLKGRKALPPIKKELFAIGY